MIYFIDESGNKYPTITDAIRESLINSGVRTIKKINQEGCDSLEISEKISLIDFCNIASEAVKEVFYYCKNGILLGQNFITTVNGKEETYFYDYGYLFDNPYYYDDIAIDNEGNKYKVSFPMLSIFGNNPTKYNPSVIQNLKYGEASYKSLHYDFINSYGIAESFLFSRELKKVN